MYRRTGSVTLASPAASEAGANPLQLREPLAVDYSRQSCLPQRFRFQAGAALAVAPGPGIDDVLRSEHDVGVVHYRSLGKPQPAASLGGVLPVVVPLLFVGSLGGWRRKRDQPAGWMAGGHSRSAGRVLDLQILPNLS